jgi:Replication-relaxation
MVQKRRREDQNAQPLALQTRDFAVFYAICQCGALTARQISALFFPPYLYPIEVPSANCQYRLRLFRTHNYLSHIEQPQIPSDGRKPYLYQLTSKGVQALAAYLGCTVKDLPYHKRDSRLSAFFLEHLILGNDVRVCLTLAARKHNVQIAAWHDELTLKRTHSADKLTITDRAGREYHNLVLVPDGFIHLHTEQPVPHDFFHFLEIDRGTETGQSSVEGRRTWERKILLYREYYTSGAYFQRYGTKGLRILTVVKSEKRLAHLKQIIEQAGGRGRYWITTFELITAQTVLSLPIWQKAGSSGLFALLSDAGGETEK